jgi:hypothetical protein
VAIPLQVISRKTAFALVVLATTLAGGAGRPARAEEVAIEKQVLVVVRALSYDNNLAKRAGDAIVIAALSKAGVASSEAGGEAVAKAFKQLGNVKVQGLALRSTHVRFTNPAALVTAIEAQGIDVFYIGPGMDAELAAVLEVSRKKQVITIGAREDQVKKGASLGVVSIGAKTTIVVNLTASKSEGTAFALDLLRLAKVIR